MFKITGLTILGRVDTHTFLITFFLDFLCILNGIWPLKMHKIIKSPRKPEIYSRFHQ